MEQVADAAAEPAHAAGLRAPAAGDVHALLHRSRAGQWHDAVVGDAPVVVLDVADDRAAAERLLGGLVSKVHDAGIPTSDIEKLCNSLEPGQAAAIAVAKEGDEDKVQEILFNNGGEVVRVSVTDDLKSALEDEAPAGVTVAEDGSAAESA